MFSLVARCHGEWGSQSRSQARWRSRSRRGLPSRFPGPTRGSDAGWRADGSSPRPSPPAPPQRHDRSVGGAASRSRWLADECPDRGSVLRPGNEVPSQCPGTARSAASAGRSATLTMPATRPRRSVVRRVLRSARPVRRHVTSSRRRPPTTALHVEAAVDCLVGDAHRLVVWVVDQQAVADLLGAVLGMQPILHVLTQPVIALEHPRLRTPGALVSQGLGHGGSIAGLAAHGPAAQLPADR